MSWLVSFARSTVGMKIIMAISGVALFGFVIAHMAGNLQIFLGAEVFNAYGSFMQGNKEVLWVLRLGLLSVIVAHIYSAVVLTMRSKASRGVNYKAHKWLSGSYAVRTMRFGGIVILLFVIYHLLHFTVGSVHPEFVHCSGHGESFTCDPYNNVIKGFRVWWVVAFYVVAQLALGMHLAHGVWSMLRTLGLNNPRYDAIVRKAATAFATIIVVGNCAIPLSVLAGIVG